MFGKFFATTFTGSMMGSGTDVFAVWGYVIANAQHSQIELNPKLLAAVLGSTPEAMEKAVSVLCSPDPNSRSTEENGVRLIREGQFAYRVVNHEKYRALRNDEDRRAYFRQKKAESRARLADEPVKARSQTKSKCPPMSTVVTQPDTEPENREQNQEDALPEKSSGERGRWQAEFDELWSICKKKVGKLKARKAYFNARKGGEMPDLPTVKAALDRLQRTEKWTEKGRQFQPYMEAWLNRGGWDDEIPQSQSEVEPENVPRSHRPYVVGSVDGY
jgi:hypothetical protein